MDHQQMHSRDQSVSLDRTRNMLYQQNKPSNLGVQVRPLNTLKQGGSNILNNSSVVMTPKKMLIQSPSDFRVESQSGQKLQNGFIRGKHNSMNNSFYLEKSGIKSPSMIGDNIMGKSSGQNFGFQVDNSNQVTSPKRGNSSSAALGVGSTMQYTVSVNDVVKSNLRQSPFGIEYYNPPKMERAYLLKPHYGKIDRQKIKNFAEIEAKSKQFIPGPQYNTTTDWNKVMPTQTGKFLKSHRITLAGEILKNKDKTTPSPGQYESAPWKKINDKIIGNYNLKEDRGSFIEEASFFGTQTPSANYNEVKFVRIQSISKFLQDNYKERTRFTKIMATKKARFEKIEKIDGPAPGSYKIEEAFTKTQWVSKKPAVDKSKNMSFIDNFKKAHQYCPGVGSYQKFEEGFNKISKSPRSLAIKRH